MGTIVDKKLDGLWSRFWIDTGGSSTVKRARG